MVKLKWGMEYKGYLVSVDGYMNMQVRAPGQVSQRCGSLIPGRAGGRVGWGCEQPGLGEGARRRGWNGMVLKALCVPG